MQAKTEIGNISLYGGSEKCSPSFFVDENTEFVKKSVQAFCRKNSKEEIYANFNRNRGAVINVFKNKKIFFLIKNLSFIKVRKRRQ